MTSIRIWVINRNYFATNPPLQDNGHGNREGSTIWVLISAILLTIMRDQGFGLDTLSCMSSLALVIVGFAFVSDTNIINATKSVNIERENLLKQQQ